MKTQILNKLTEIENRHDIEILFAAESGSRAWGFASPDSDYDIRFIYKHKQNWYLNLWDKPDTIEFITEDDLDGSGWDLRKTLKLLAKSNASLLGWLFSPIIYRADEIFLKKIQQVAVNNFNPVAGFYHYHSMSKNFLQKVNSNEVKLKSFFYALRTALCSKWILEKQTIPPVEFNKCFELLNQNTISEIEDLIELKSKQNERFILQINSTIFSFLKETIATNERNAKNALSKKPNTTSFNNLFISTVNQ